MIDLNKAKGVVAEFQALLGRTPSKAVHVRIAPDAWTLAEIVGHLIDSASNNHQRFVRLRLCDLEGFPGYEAEPWVKAQGYDGCDFRMLAALWMSYNAYILHLAANIPDSAKANVWKKPEGPKTLEFLTADYYEHLKLHAEHYAKRLAEVEAVLARS